jgi:hypothetical protein
MARLLGVRRRWARQPLRQLPLMTLLACLAVHADLHNGTAEILMDDTTHVRGACGALQSLSPVELRPPAATVT